MSFYGCWLFLDVFVHLSVAHVGEPGLGEIISAPINWINDVCATENGPNGKIQCIFKIGNVHNTVF